MRTHPDRGLTPAQLHRRYPQSTILVIGTTRTTSDAARQAPATTRLGSSENHADQGEDISAGGPCIHRLDGEGFEDRWTIWEDEETGR